MLILYVKDIVLTGNDPTLLQDFIQSLGSVFDLKDLGPLHCFLGIQVQTTTTGIHHSQTKYAYDLLK